METGDSSDRAHKKHGDLFYMLYTGVACAIIMALLQPFGIDRVEHHKYPIILGYAVLAAVAYQLANLQTIYVLRMPRRDEWDVKRSIIVGLLICPIMGAFICCYSAWAYAGDIRQGWFYPDGRFTLKAFWINSGYTLTISFFLTLFGYYMERSRQLAIRLQEVIELNRILAQKQLAEEKRDTPQAPSGLSQGSSSDAPRSTGTAPSPDTSGITTAANSPDTSGATEAAAYCDTSGTSAGHSDTSVSPLRLEGSSRETVELQSSAQLLFVESDGNYALVHYLSDGKAVRKAVRCTLKQVEEQLSGRQGIMRCHRAYIVNIAHVEHVSGNGQGYRLTLDSIQEQVPVSRQYAAAVYQSIRI